MHFYPKTFKIDLNGKKWAWQGVALLPFVSEKELLSATNPLENKLNDEQKRRNRRGFAQIFVSQTSELGKYLKKNQSDATQSVTINYDQKFDISGTFKRPEDPLPERNYKAIIPQMEDIVINRAQCYDYLIPELPADHKFEAKMLPGANLPLDIVPRKNEHKFLYSNHQSRRDYPSQNDVPPAKSARYENGGNFDQNHHQQFNSSYHYHPQSSHSFSSSHHDQPSFNGSNQHYIDPNQSYQSYGSNQSYPNHPHDSHLGQMYSPHRNCPPQDMPHHQYQHFPPHAQMPHPGTPHSFNSSHSEGASFHHNNSFNNSSNAPQNYYPQQHYQPHPRRHKRG